MLVDSEALLAALRLPADSTVDAEPATTARGLAERVALCPPGGGQRLVLVRRDADEAIENNLAVLEAIARTGYPRAPAPLALIPVDGGLASVETWDDGLTAMNVEPSPAQLEAAVDALAALHALDVREGLRWERSPEELVPGEEIPLHRLGFAAHEREPAAAPLAEAAVVLRGGPFGFVHGDAVATNVLFAPGGLRVVGFQAAGFGPQLFDFAAFLATSGARAGQRRELAGRYARSRGLDVFATIDNTDLATILWGLGELLTLPRRLIEMLGDDAGSAALRLAASRIEQAMREPAGGSPVAAAIRAALWPS
ncbi:MAG: aminoglycoside phosphotransferase family protein [Hyphomicrobiales bacterium]